MSSPSPASHRARLERPGPVGGKRDRNRRARHAALRQAALALFLQKGVEAVSIDEIVRQVGIAKGSFYNYFRSKAALVEALIAPVAERTREAYDTCAADLRAADSELALFAAYTAMGGALSAIVEEDAAIVRLYLQENRAPETETRQPMLSFAEEMVERTVELTRIAVERDLLREVDPTTTALAVVGAVERLLHAHFQKKLQSGSVDVVKDLILLVLQGLLRD